MAFSSKQYEVTPEASRVKLKFKLNNDIAEHVSVADALARRWLIPSLQPDMTDQEQLEELE